MERERRKLNREWHSIQYLRIIWEKEKSTNEWDGINRK